MVQKLEYINEGRGGYVVYKVKQGDIKLFFEYGGVFTAVAQPH